LTVPRPGIGIRLDRLRCCRGHYDSLAHLDRIRPTGEGRRRSVTAVLNLSDG
jgi:hypothetical protein